ncbi:MAG TPA: hypothetical protein VN897_17320, partial [Mycobacterium sp.]|nr:hypothetical protein [Mycobacterium sp.]
VVTVVLLGLLQRPFGKRTLNKQRRKDLAEPPPFEPAFPTPALPGQRLVPATKATKETANG